MLLQDAKVNSNMLWYLQISPAPWLSPYYHLIMLGLMNISETSCNLREVDLEVSLVQIVIRASATVIFSVSLSALTLHSHLHSLVTFLGIVVTQFFQVREVFVSFFC